ncbi:uncharacterized protein DSM5745_09752 [Aspergillus mulundensis]|uniref:Uncharacterized protein n=1 Tax=Aspergillus mulundensis TaxID=1810919 RepID=A0A3D8QRK8_9EURO|nr:Uncharacterized protein DSM5745_09752 [Aspergillus mulundensis]RDW64341.1 Uncharacterized protein DSM5745_09752 [Aspergillus mulundensis]
MSEAWQGVIDADLRYLAQLRYPDLSANDAYVAYCTDIVESVAGAAGPVFDTALDLAEIFFLIKCPELLRYTQVGRLSKKGVEKLIDYFRGLSADPQSTLGNLTADKKEISTQLASNIVKQLESSALGQATAVTNGVGTAAAGASLSGESGTNIQEVVADNTSAQATSAASASSGPAESFLDRINYLECWNTALRTIQTAQAQQIIRALNVIADHLGDRNCIAVMGAGGPDGFARPIYDLIKMKINKIDAADRKNHRFFIYHDSNNWHPAFERLTRENTLPSQFVNNPCDDLDHVCLFMREVRQKLIAKDEKLGKAITFHLLIPSWSKLQIKEPLHFPEDLYPLQIEGLKHGGQDQVELNLPRAPVGLLHGVSNVLDPNHWNTIAGGTSAAVTVQTVGWGINGACLAVGIGLGTLTGAGMLLAAPVWVGSAALAMPASAPVIEETIYDALREEDPRVLGSKERLPRRR